MQAASDTFKSSINLLIFRFCEHFVSFGRVSDLRQKYEEIQKLVSQVIKCNNYLIHIKIDYKVIQLELFEFLKEIL